jgi:uncharacterized protein (DUF433 family)
MDWRAYIEQTPDVMMGKPCIKGTRLSVAFILERLGDGWSTEDLMKNFDLRPDQIQAAQAYAAAWMQIDEPTLRSG